MCCIAGFHFNRLSILDLSEQGHQPMVDHDGTVFPAFNGEVHNGTCRRPGPRSDGPVRPRPGRAHPRCRDQPASGGPARRRPGGGQPIGA
ncbi:MAG TPA: hypothetical protein VEQ10_06915 [Vicinamibacteria bacterium]|nr:hypothetical protein [Vicinamibacteria bacterium]